jgi:hypothetical protein
LGHLIQNKYQKRHKTTRAGRCRSCAGRGRLVPAPAPVNDGEKSGMLKGERSSRNEVTLWNEKSKMVTVRSRSRFKNERITIFLFLTKIYSRLRQSSNKTQNIIELKNFLLYRNVSELIQIVFSLTPFRLTVLDSEAK